MSANDRVADSLVVHLTGDDLRARGDRRHDRRLGTGVETLDVGGRVTLGVAEALGFGEGGLVGHPLLAHLREDVVRRPVDDSHDPRDRFTAQALAQGPHDRNAPGDGRLEEQVDAGLLGNLEQLDPDVGQQLLVGGDHWLARSERGGDQFAGRFDATDDLDDEVDVRIGDHGGRVVGEQGRVDLDVTAPREVAHRNTHDVETDSRASLDLLRPGERRVRRTTSRRCRSRAPDAERSSSCSSDNRVEANDGVDDLIELAAT